MFNMESGESFAFPLFGSIRPQRGSYNILMMLCLSMMYNLFWMIVKFPSCLQFSTLYIYLIYRLNDVLHVP